MFLGEAHYILGLQIVRNRKQRYIYRQFIGNLSYIAQCTRPEICFAVNKLAAFNNCYGPDHWSAAKRILRYSKYTADYNLRFGGSSPTVAIYVDADWAGENIHRFSRVVPRSCNRS